MLCYWHTVFLFCVLELRAVPIIAQELLCSGVKGVSPGSVILSFYAVVRLMAEAAVLWKPLACLSKNFGNIFQRVAAVMAAVWRDCRTSDPATSHWLSISIGDSPV